MLYSAEQLPRCDLLRLPFASGVRLVGLTGPPATNGPPGRRRRRRTSPAGASAPDSVPCRSARRRGVGASVAAAPVRAPCVAPASDTGAPANPRRRRVRPPDSARESGRPPASSRPRVVGTAGPGSRRRRRRLGWSLARGRPDSAPWPLHAVVGTGPVGRPPAARVGRRRRRPPRPSRPSKKNLFFSKSSGAAATRLGFDFFFFFYKSSGAAATRLGLGNNFSSFPAGAAATRLGLRIFFQNAGHKS